MTEQATEHKPRKRTREPRTTAPARQDKFLVGRRPLKVGDKIFQIGEEVPGAADWPRVESWVRAGRIVKQSEEKP